MSALFNTSSDPFNFTLEYPNGDKQNYTITFSEEGALVECGDVFTPEPEAVDDGSPEPPQEDVT